MGVLTHGRYTGQKGTAVPVLSGAGVSGGEKTEYGNDRKGNSMAATETPWYQSEDILSDELYTCWRERVKQKKYTYEAYCFERNLGAKLDKMTKEVMDLTWRPKRYHNFTIYHPQRTICAPCYEDRIVEMWLTKRYLEPYVVERIVPENVGCQKGKGPPAAHKAIMETLCKAYETYGTNFYFLQYDMQGYYDNINHEMVKEIFEDLPHEAFVLLCNIVDDWDNMSGYAKEADPSGRYGVPKGNLPSQWIGTMYLNSIDRLIKYHSKCLGFTRYMDDTITFFPDKAGTKDCKIQVEEHLRKYDFGVRLHPRKTVYAPIARGFTFCGWHYTMNKNGHITVKMRTDRKKLTEQKIAKIAEDYHDGKLTYEEAKNKVNGSYAHMRQSPDTRDLIKYCSNQYRFTRDDETYAGYKKRNNSMKQNRRKRYERRKRNAEKRKTQIDLEKNDLHRCSPGPHDTGYVAPSYCGSDGNDTEECPWC